MKFASFTEIEKGALAERPIQIPCHGRDGKPTDLPSLLVPLVGEEETTALAYALRHALSAGVKDPAPEDPLYDLGYQAQVVALAYKDPDVGEPGNRQPTFAGADEVLGGLSRETITYLYAQFQEWAERCSPTRRDASVEEILAGIRAIANEGDDGLRFFARCGPSMRWSLMHIMAKALVSSPEIKLDFGSSSPATAPTATTPSSSP